MNRLNWTDSKDVFEAKTGAFYAKIETVGGCHIMELYAESFDGRLLITSGGCTSLETAKQDMELWIRDCAGSVINCSC